MLNTATGELVRGRCRATNLCPYCRTMYVVETVEMLTIDACEYAPTIWTVLTARNHLTRRDTYSHLRQLRKAVRERWPDAEWFVQVEFQRRGALHLNLLHKGVPVDEWEQLHELLVERWCARPGIDARPSGQWSEPVDDGVGAVRYIAKILAHGLKVEQAPPLGWKGHRTSQTRGYLVRPASAMRAEAKRSLRVKRGIWRGLDAATAEAEVAVAELVEWKLQPVDPSTADVSIDRRRELPESSRLVDDAYAVLVDWRAELRAAHVT